MKTTAGLPAVAARKSKAASRVGGSNSVVESQPSKLLVAGSIPVSRSKNQRKPVWGSIAVRDGC